MGQITNECNPELVSAFLDNELDQIILGRVARHLMNCDHCRQTMSRLAQVRDAVSETFALCDPEGLTNSVMMAINNEKSTSPRDHLNSRRFRFGIFGLFLVVMLAGVAPERMDVMEHVEVQAILA